MNVAAIESKSSDTHKDLPDEASARSNDSFLEQVLLQVRLRAHRRAAWLAHLGSGESDDTGMVLAPNLITVLDGRDTPEAEAAWYERATDVQSLNEQIAQVERALAGDAGTQLRQLGTRFRLSQPEVELLQTCLAVAVEPGFGMVYAHLQQHPARTYATAVLAARLFGHGHSPVWSEGCALAVWGLVSAGDATAGEPAPLSIDPLIVAWLYGELRNDPVLSGLVQVIEQRAPLDSWPVESVTRMVKLVTEREWSVRLVVSGPPASGRRTFAAMVAAGFGMQTLSVDTTGIAELDWPDIFMRAQRLAVLGGMALVWHGSQLNRKWPVNIAPAPIQFIACDLDEVVLPCEYVIDHRIDLPAPTLEERRGLWKAAIPGLADWPTRELETLVSRYHLNPGDIASVAQSGPVNAHEAGEFARELTRHRLGRLGRLIDCPFSRDDLIVTDKLRDALADYTFEARDRTTFWESQEARRLFPRGRGLMALFSGPPGTGKTMAAQVIAAELKLDLFRIDLASVVSKYIGETAKHLGQIFSRAARMNAVLLFDEADALFSKRTDVKDSHDRYANADTGYLLQMLEDHTGIVILASNKRQNIDPAFIRRVRYVFEFPRPDATERRRIWRQVIGELLGNETWQRLESTIEAIASSIKLSGAQIKNAVLASIFIARRNRAALEMTHLLNGIDRELIKEGRALGAHERERLVRGGG